RPLPALRHLARSRRRGAPLGPARVARARGLDRVEAAPARARDDARRQGAPLPPPSGAGGAALRRRRPPRAVGRPGEPRARPRRARARADERGARLLQRLRAPGHVPRGAVARGVRRAGADRRVDGGAMEVAEGRGASLAQRGVLRPRAAIDSYWHPTTPET